jgi:hypothetical protein
MPVLGSVMAGTRPLGLIFLYAGVCRIDMSMNSCSYGSPSSSRMTATFQGLGPEASAGRGKG